MSRYDRMSTFVIVVEEGSFAACARKLGISTAAVSKQVQQLESELGMQLMHRSTRKLALTEAGSTYLEQALRVISEMKELDALAEGMQKEPQGRLLVAAQRHFAETYILPSLAKFLASYPKITLHLELIERFPDIEKEEIDIVIGMSRANSPNSIQKTIAYTYYALCASPAYLREFGMPSTPQELQKHRYINHSIRIPVHITKFKNGLEVFVEPYLLLNDTQAMKRCALDGIGIVKLHRYVVDEEIKSGKLVEILAEYNEPKQPIYANYAPHKHVPPRIRAFLDFFK